MIINPQPQIISIKLEKMVELLFAAKKLLSNAPDGHFLQTKEEYLKKCWNLAEEINAAFEQNPQ